MRRLALLASLVAFACGPKPPAASTEPTAATEPPAADASADATEPAEDLPPAEEVLEQAVVALGGRDKLEAIQSFYSEAKMEIPAQNLSADIKTWWKRSSRPSGAGGGDFYMENDMTGVGVTKIWKKGEEIWAEDPINGRRKLEGKEAAQTKWSASMSLAADWKEFFATAKTTGRSKTEDGAELIDVELTDADGTSVTLSFDAQTHLPRQQSFKQKSPMGEIPVRVTMEDYRDVAGVQTSFRSTTSMAIIEAVQTVEKFEPNVKIDDKKFTPK
jgi:hypothetical protein